MRNRDVEDMKVRTWTILGVVFLVLTILLVACTAVLNLVGPKYEYQDAVHSHMENAYWGSTPELMMTELNLSIQGMRDIGLVEGMNAKLMPWKQTPDWSMDYQFAHIEAIIERCQEVIDWRDSQDLTSGQISDVYNQKMENLKGFIVEGGWSDDIAEAAWYANFHTWYIFWVHIIGGVLICITTFCFGKAIVWTDQDDFDLKLWVWLCAIIIYVATVFLVVAHSLGV